MRRETKPGSFDTYGYTAENRLSGKGYERRDGDMITGGTTTRLAYDPLGRLFHINGSASDFLYDGEEVIGEKQAYGGGLRKRFVHGPGIDEPLVVYDASGAKRWFHADERGSIVATSDASGNAATVHRYDEYGVPQDAIPDRFGYTGQMWLPEAGVYSYKARMYDAGRGRFLQSDPIRYAAGMNLYAYVKADPVNFTDPTGLMTRAECKARQDAERAKGEAGVGVVCGGGGGGGFGAFGDFGGGWGMTSFSAFGGGGGGSGLPGEQGRSTPLPQCLVPAGPSVQAAAVNKALREILGSSSGPVASSLSSDFAALDRLPDFSRKGWIDTVSGHSRNSYDFRIPSRPDYVLKVYVNDSSFGGRHTAAITDYTYSASHIGEALLGTMTFGAVNNNDYRAADYNEEPCY